jgi:hypothetical protein
MSDNNVTGRHMGGAANAAKLKTGKGLDKHCSWFHTTSHMLGPDQQHSHSMTH